MLIGWSSVWLGPRHCLLLQTQDGVKTLDLVLSSHTEQTGREPCGAFSANIGTLIMALNPFVPFSQQ